MDGDTNESRGSGRGERTPVTVLGLGLMGSALARTLLAKQHPTTVWNRSSGRAGELVSRGAVEASSLAEAVALSPVVIVCVSGYEAMRQIVEPVGERLSGHLLVNLTSGTPTEARAVAAWAAELGVDYLDGAIMATPPLIGGPETLILYGGSQGAFEEHAPTLMTLGGQSTFLAEDVGVPLFYDLALLGMLWTTTAGYLHALALVSSAGVEPAEFVPFATAWFEHVLSPDLGDTAAEVAAGEFATEVSSIEVNKAAMDHLIAASRTAGIATELFEPIKALLDRQVDEGRGAGSLASLIELLRRPEPPAAQ
jgi:3-hydroxyisobutyrate dehydrogenase-like beta-hydroxyacid dehydrogenase